jgi:uncharacterized protein (DUF433 family)
MADAPRIVVEPEICHGKPVIRGTRIMVENILSLRWSLNFGQGGKIGSCS